MSPNAIEMHKVLNTASVLSSTTTVSTQEKNYNQCILHQDHKLLTITALQFSKRSVYFCCE